MCFINKQKTIKAAKKSMENGNVSVRFVFGSNGFLGDHSFYVEYIRNVKNNIVLGVAHSSVIHFFVLISRDGNNGKLFETNVFCVVVVFFLFLLARSVCCCSNLLLHFTFLKLVECFSKCHSQLLR